MHIVTFPSELSALWAVRVIIARTCSKRALWCMMLKDPKETNIAKQRFLVERMENIPLPSAFGHIHFECLTRDFFEIKKLVKLWKLRHR